MKLSELIACYGDDKVQFQNLDQCAKSMNMNGGTTTITFGTEQRVHFEGMEKLGLVVWFDRERVAEITASMELKGTSVAQSIPDWRSIDTAPRDGSVFLALTMEAQSPKATLSKFEDGKFLAVSLGEKFVCPGWSRWWPTHWMPLPAAPASEGRDDG